MLSQGCEKCFHFDMLSPSCRGRNRLRHPIFFDFLNLAVAGPGPDTEAQNLSQQQKRGQSRPGLDSAGL